MLAAIVSMSLGAAKSETVPVPNSSSPAAVNAAVWPAVTPAFNVTLAVVETGALMLIASAAML